MPTDNVVKWSLSELKRHPCQPAFFLNTCKQELKELVVDLRKNGRHEPIRILPDGTVICGHRRVAATKLLRWAQIDAVVMHELVGKEQAVEELLIKDNFNRRQLSPLERVRCVKRLSELAHAGRTHPTQHLSKGRQSAHGPAKSESSKRLEVRVR